MNQIERFKNATLPNTEILSVTYETDGVFRAKGERIKDLPPFYRVILCSRPATTSEIYTEVWLPDAWNGIFLGLGNGGMAGRIWHWDLADKIKKGYAAACTDLGTSRGRTSGINNPEVWKDFGWRATHLMTDAAKTLLRRLYGKKESYSYFLGCSTGGQQALAEAQRFPQDYDGILAGVPANNRTMLHIYFLWNHLHLRPNGKPLFSRAEIETVTACAVQYFQGLGDGETGDCFITFPKGGAELIDDFLRFLARECPHLSNTQMEALRAIS